VSLHEGGLPRLSIVTACGCEMVHASVQVSEDPSELGVQDYVAVAVKAPSLPDVVRQIGPLLGPETAVVTAMNGVPWWFFLNAKGVLAGHQLKAIDPDGTIGQAIPTRRVIGCVLYIAASVDEPGLIRTVAAANFSSGSLTTG
jgi:2-dehydropantoate 2-reductase